MTEELAALTAELVARLGARVDRDAPSAALTTYRVGGPIRTLVHVKDAQQLGAVVDVVAGSDVETLVVGMGSNLLVADAGFDGIGILLDGEFERLELDIASGVVTAGGATSLPVLARRSAAAGLSGLEFFVGIPGSVGGAVRMNAGGHGRETAEVLVDVEVVSLVSGSRRTLDVDELDLSYRHSAIGAGDVVARARFAGSQDEPEACAGRIAKIVRWRREHQPGGANAGSVFSNPPGDSAGRLIDVSGCKGLRVGGAHVSLKHANFIQADLHATAADIVALLSEVGARVEARTGIRLERELRLVGFGSEL